ncbi:hypothetical protein ACQKWADRAFT_321480 [Trichoderma austrokoningii]
MSLEAGPAVPRRPGRPRMSEAGGQRVANDEARSYRNRKQNAFVLAKARAEVFEKALDSSIDEFIQFYEQVSKKKSELPTELIMELNTTAMNIISIARKARKEHHTSGGDQNRLLEDTAADSNGDAGSDRDPSTIIADWFNESGKSIAGANQFSKNDGHVAVSSPAPVSQRLLLACMTRAMDLLQYGNLHILALDPTMLLPLKIERAEDLLERVSQRLSGGPNSFLADCRYGDGRNAHLPKMMRLVEGNLNTLRPRMPPPNLERLQFGLTRTMLHTTNSDFQGEWLEASDVEEYLEQRGIFIRMGSPSDVIRLCRRTAQVISFIPAKMESKTTPARKPSGKKIKRRVAIACTACRGQHLRCDAAMPICSRCRSLDKECFYTDLRETRRRRPGIGLVNKNDEIIDMVDNMAQAVEPNLVSTEPSLTPNRSSTPSSPPSIFAASNGGLQPIVFADNDLLISRPVDGFYKFFFPSHPFILPRVYLKQQFESNSDFSGQLFLMITFIGSRYIHDPQSTEYKKQAEESFDLALSPNGFTVQALLLFSLTLEWAGENDGAAATLGRARNMALEIGMHHRNFAYRHGYGEKVLEESWRRTWWELFVADAMFAGIRHLPTFMLWAIETDVDIPCEEELYITGRIPFPQTMRQYDDRGLNDESFSSFAYLIDAARILGTTLAAGDTANESPYSLVKNAEANLMSWNLYLPQTKRDPVRRNGTIDEILFKAHMVMNTPRSMLHYTTMELLCSKYAPPLPGEISTVETQHGDRHTHKAISAAKNFVDLLTASSSPLTHSPFVMCMGSLAIATLLSAYEHFLTGSELVHARDRVRVFLGVLKAFTAVWPQAQHWSEEIKLMARVVLERRDGSATLEISALQSMTNIEGASFN